ncbi:MAG TPA: precorrin-6y C5,15-methyltransferase (decarboxylating) subunit CbiE, partial [Acidimicrobiales bacterium]
MADRPIHVVGLHAGRPVGAEAVAAVAGASLVAGSPAQLAGVADLVRPDAATEIVGAGLAAMDAVAAHEGATCVLASGDPGFHGIVRALAARFGPERLVVHPAPSSVALAFARLGLPWQDAVVASAHTGEAARAAAAVAGAPTAAVLCGPAAPPEAVGAALHALGAHPTVVAVASHLGEPDESVVHLPDLAALAASTFDHRSVVVIAHDDPATGSKARTGGRPVADFAHRAGMITKPEVRSVVLGRLDLPDRGVLWDVGAGSGSVAIEASLAAPGLRVIAVERDPAAADQIVANAAALGALVEVVVGAAPDALAALPRPDRVFVGGGGLGALDAGIDALLPGGRIVATFAAIDRAVDAHARLGSLVQVSVDQARPLPDGGLRFVADNPVFVAWGDRPHAAIGDETDDSIDELVVVGVGCSSHATAAEVAEVAAEALRASGGAAAHEVATIDRRADHPAVIALAGDRPLHLLPSELLALVDVPHPSATVEGAVGTPSVAEAAALLAAGPGARLVATKHRNATATAAVATGRRADRPGRITVVGLGPGGVEHRTPAAGRAVRSADAVVGYGPYVDAAGPALRGDQLVLRSSMGAEAGRATAAVALAGAGWDVAIVSSGDPGTFAMASVTIEVAAEAGLAVTIVPGVTSAAAAAAVVGAPLAGPHVALTLSDLLIPWSVIEEQLRAAASAGLAIALFNPRSKGRPDHLGRAVAILLEQLPATTP